MTFFGLSNDYRNVFRDEVYNLATKSHGGISYLEAWHMPIALRRYNLKKVIEEIKRHNEEVSKLKGEMTADDFVKNKTMFKAPDYVTKAPKK